MVIIFVILTYDVKNTRCNQYLKVSKQFLFHRQNSVFDGNITEKKLKLLCKKLDSLKKENDSYCIYVITDYRQIKTIGRELLPTKDYIIE